MDLLPTLRSRSLAVFLGPAEAVDPAAVEPLARAFGSAVARHTASGGAAIYLLTAAEALTAAGGWEDPRAGRPWAMAAAAVLRSLEIEPMAPAPPAARRARLALAEALLGAPAMRLRGVSAERILEGLVARHLAS
jgi:hypothetical protein